MLIIEILCAAILASLAVIAVLTYKYIQSVRYAKSAKTGYKHLRWHLNKLLDQWAMGEYCPHCKQWSNSSHYVDCPQMTIRFAITKAEQKAAQA